MALNAAVYCFLIMLSVYLMTDLFCVQISRAIIHSRLQILTIADLLDGKRVDMPPLRQVNVTFKKAPKAKGEEPEMPTLPM